MVTPPPTALTNPQQPLEPVEEAVGGDRVGTAMMSEGGLQSRDVKASLTWVHLLAYTAILQRMCNLDTLALGDNGATSPVRPKKWQMNVIFF